MQSSEQKVAIYPKVLWGSLAVIAALGMVWLIAHKSHRKAVTANVVVASANDTLIYQSDVNKLSPPIPAGDATSLLVDFALLDQAAARKHVSVSAAEMDQLRANIVAVQGTSSYSEGAKKLNRNTYGLDLQLQHSRMLEKLAALELSRTSTNMIHVRGILIKPGGKNATNESQARQFALKLSKEAGSGANFASLAKRFTDDGISQANGGDLGIIQGDMPSIPRYGLDNHFTNAMVAASETGRVDSPVKGDLGYWAVQVLSTAKHPGKDGPLYDGALALWRSYWVNKLEPGVMARLRDKAIIEPPLETKVAERGGRQ